MVAVKVCLPQAALFASELGHIYTWAGINKFTGSKPEQRFLSLCPWMWVVRDMSGISTFPGHRPISTRRTTSPPFRRTTCWVSWSSGKASWRPGRSAVRAGGPWTRPGTCRVQQTTGSRSPWWCCNRSCLGWSWVAGPGTSRPSSAQGRDSEWAHRRPPHESAPWGTPPATARGAGGTGSSAAPCTRSQCGRGGSGAPRATGRACCGSGGCEGPGCSQTPAAQPGPGQLAGAGRQDSCPTHALGPGGPQSSQGSSLPSAVQGLWRASELGTKPGLAGSVHPR